MVHEEPMPWMMKQLEDLGLAPKKLDGKNEDKPAINTEPPDMSWYKRGEECPF